MKISNIAPNILPNFNARIPKDTNVVSAFEYAQNLLATNEPKKLKEVGEFCTSVKNILGYKPTEELNLAFEKTSYSRNTNKGLEFLFVYYACDANISNDSVSGHFGARVSNQYHQKIFPAKLCFDVLKALGKEIGTPKENPFRGDLGAELEGLKLLVLG